MIKLIGVISKGGIPLRLRTSIEKEGKLFISGMIEVVKGLSSIMGSGEVRMLEFKDDKLIVTESEKEFTVVALVSRAAEHLESLIRIIAEDIDRSGIAQPGGKSDPAIAKQIDKILDRYLEDKVDIDLRELLAETWEPILSSVKQKKRFVKQPPNGGAWPRHLPIPALCLRRGMLTRGQAYARTCFTSRVKRTRGVRPHHTRE